MVDNWLRLGMIEPGISEWSSPGFPVPKKNPGEFRGVVDFRALNNATLKDSYPLPRVDEILQRQGKYKMWSVIDIRMGYHQIPLKEECRHLSCMSTPKGNFQWRVLPMGVVNGNSIFQREMDWIFRDEENVDTFVDETIVGSTGEGEEVGEEP